MWNHSLPQIPALFGHEVWGRTPVETDPDHFETWQRVAVALQRALRKWIPAAYLSQHPSNYEDRRTAYQFVVYESCRPFFGQPRTEFTYDIADPDTLPSALRCPGRAMRRVLHRIQAELYARGCPELARRYLPVWQADVLREVRHRPELLIRLIANEARLINAVIDLGTFLAEPENRDPSVPARALAIQRFSRIARASLRSMKVGDTEEVLRQVLTETVRVLSNQCGGGFDHSSDFRVFQNRDMATPGSPYPVVTGGEDGDHRRTDGGGEVRNPGIVSDINAGSRKPAAEIVEIGDANRAGKLLLGSDAELSWDGQAGGDSTEVFEGPVLRTAA
jgi:hypothetical protein